MTKYTSSWAAAIGYSDGSCLSYHNSQHLHGVTGWLHLAAEYETEHDALANGQEHLRDMLLQDKARSQVYKKRGLSYPVRTIHAIFITAKEKAASARRMRKPRAPRKTTAS